MYNISESVKLNRLLCYENATWDNALLNGEVTAIIVCRDDTFAQKIRFTFQPKGEDCGFHAVLRDAWPRRKVAEFRKRSGFSDEGLTDRGCGPFSLRLSLADHGFNRE